MITLLRAAGLCEMLAGLAAKVEAVIEAIVLFRVGKGAEWHDE